MRARLPRRGECRGDGAHRPVCGAIPRAAVPHSHRAASVSPDAVHPLRAARPGRSPIARPGTPYQQPPVGARAEGKVRGLRGGGAGRPGALREQCQTVELPELVRGHERRIAALEDETRRLWRALAAAQKAQAL